MNKQEAIAEMQKGKKVTHKNFVNEEWMTMKGSNAIITFEDGVKIPLDDFYRIRNDKNWEGDYYSIFDESKVAVSKLGVAIDELRKHLIGYVRLPASTTQSLVLECIDLEDETACYIKAVETTSILGLHMTYIQVPKSSVKLFPDGKTMYEILQEPLKFDEWTIL